MTKKGIAFGTAEAVALSTMEFGAREAAHLK
jgi:hypothetical protein